MIDLDIPPQVVVVEGHSFLIRRKRIRTLSFRVRPEDESVRVSVPWLMSEQRVLEFLRNQIPWIERARERWKGLKVLRPPRFEDGEEFLFRGETLKLALYRVPPSMPVRTPLLTRADGELRLYLRARDSKRACVRALDEWYRDELNRILPPIL
ncbi:MAG: DUF45 domain-containing protein, partial [Proteobacteria bacterium]|nr:DUF45 domain-containing protein [Pseudomonadota bacterium]